MLSLFNEIKIMRGIKDHPNLIKFEEVFEGDNTFYLVMEIVEGISLYDEIKRHASIPYKGFEIAALLKMILEAVNFLILHQRLNLLLVIISCIETLNQKIYCLQKEGVSIKLN